MSFVPLLTEEQASLTVKQVYEQLRRNYGFLPNYYQALGRWPEVIEAHVKFGGQILADGALPKVIKEQIGVVVSGINSSSYCIAAHLELLRRMGVDKPLGRKLATDYAQAPVEEKVQALFRLADKLTRRAVDIDKPDVEALGKAGWSDAAIVETVLTVAYFNFINRVSLGLGLLADF